MAFVRESPVLYYSKYKGGDKEDKRTHQGISRMCGRFDLRGIASCGFYGRRGRFGWFDAGEHFYDAFAIAVVGGGIYAPEGRDFFGTRTGKFLFEFAFALKREFVGCFFFMFSKVVKNMREAGVVPVNPGIGGVLDQFFIGVCAAKFTEICVDEFFPPDFRPCAGKVFCPQFAVALKGQIEMVAIRYFEDAFEWGDERLAVGHGKRHRLTQMIPQEVIYNHVGAGLKPARFSGIDSFPKVLDKDEKVGKVNSAGSVEIEGRIGRAKGTYEQEEVRKVNGARTVEVGAWISGDEDG